MLKKVFKIFLFSISILVSTNPTTVFGLDNDMVDQNGCIFNMGKRLVGLLSEKQAFLATAKEGKFVYEAGNVKRAGAAVNSFFENAPKSSDIMLFCLGTMGFGCVIAIGLAVGVPTITFGAMPLWALMDAITNGAGFTYNKLKEAQQKRFNSKMDKAINNALKDEKNLTQFLNNAAEILKKERNSAEIINIAKMYSIIFDAKATQFRIDGKDFNQAADQNLILPSKWTAPFDRREKILQVKAIISELDSQGELCESPNSPSAQKEPSFYFQKIKQKLEALPQ